MENLFDKEEYERWLSQAENTLQSAQGDLQGGYYNWSCFKSQQGAEYALKALLRGWGQPGTGHSVLKLLENLEDLGSSIPQELKGYARVLDKHYIPARYPNAYPAGSPFEFYDQENASQALGAARKILEFIQALAPKDE